MAIYRNGFLHGPIGDLSFREVNGQQQVSPRIKKIKQTKATKKAASTFGLATSFAAEIRDTISGQLNRFQDGQMNCRLAGKVNSIFQGRRDPKTKVFAFEEGAFAQLKGFEFNKHSPLQYLLAKLPEVKIAKNEISINVPALRIPSQFKFPKDSFRCEMTFTVSIISLVDGKKFRMPMIQKLEVLKNTDYNAPAVLSFPVPGNCIAIVSVFLTYAVAEKNGWSSINTKNFHPGCILEVVHSSAAYPDLKQYRWAKMTHKLDVEETMNDADIMDSAPQAGD